MQNLIRASLNEKGMIDKESLRKSARNYYRFEHSGNLPSIIYSKQPDYLKTPQGDNSKKAMMIYTFENANPYQFLKSKYKDGKVVERDLRILESLLTFSTGVEEAASPLISGTNFIGSGFDPIPATNPLNVSRLTPLPDGKN